MNQVRSFVVLPALPEPLKKLRELAYNLWWVWNPDAIELFRRLDLDLWRELRHNPVMMLAASGDGSTAWPATRPTSPPSTASCCPWTTTLNTRPGSRRTTGRRRPARSPISPPSSACTSPADLLRRPGRPGRRPPEERQRPGRAAGGRRACSTARAISASISTPTAGSRKLSRTTISHNLPVDAGAQRRRQAADRRAWTLPGGECRPRSGGCRSGAYRSTCWTPTSRRTRPRTATITGPALRRRPGDAHPPGDPAGHRRRAGAASRWASSPRSAT